MESRLLGSSSTHSNIIVFTLYVVFQTSFKLVLGILPLPPLVGRAFCPPTFLSDILCVGGGIRGYDWLKGLKLRPRQKTHPNSDRHELSTIDLLQ